MTQPNEYIIDGGRIIDPSQPIDCIGQVHVRDGKIAGIGPRVEAPQNVSRIDATNMIVCPGLIDIHVHLREPGAAHKETIETGARAALAGGFTTVCCMPNTTPAIDNVEAVRWIINRANQVNLSHVHPIAAVTRGRSGKELLDFAPLIEAGAVAFSDDGDGIEDDDVMREALEQARRLDTVIVAHCEFKDISKRGVVHLGPVSRRLGLPGYDPHGEEAMIQRDLKLVEETGGRYHVAHVSTAAGVEMVRQAKAKRLPVTAEVCPHHLLLCDQDVVGPDGTPDPNFKMSPPLRSRQEVAACVEGVRDGTIDCIVTDHAPHAPDEKNAGFLEAPMGVIGLETSLPCAAKALLKDGEFDWPALIERMSTAPARIFRLPGGALKSGNSADVTIIDPNLEWTIDPTHFHSKSRNTPFAGWCVRGKAVTTIVSGEKQ